MKPQNTEEIKKLEEVVSMFDYLLQEGVIFTQGEVERMDELTAQLDAIIKSIKTFNVK